MKTTYITTLCFGLFVNNLLGHDIPVHRAITKNAAVAAYSYSPAYVSFLNTIAPDGFIVKDATNSIVIGSAEEDDQLIADRVGGYRSLNHFYDPTKNPPIGLTDQPWPLRSAKIGRPSFTWASISNSPAMDSYIESGKYNIWSWPNARGYEWLGLTATNQLVRQTNLANMFRAVGQVMHLLEDASQPQHVRNEQHLDQILKMDAYSRSAIEDYYKKHTINYPQGMLDWRNAGFSKLENFWNRDSLRNEGVSALNADLSGGASTLGIAEFCNGNFIGQRATYAEFFPDHSDIHYFGFPSLANTTQPNLKAGQLWDTATPGDVTLANFKRGTRLYISKKPGAGVPVTYHSALSYLIAQQPGKSGGLPVLTIADDNVLSNYHAIFIPKAVEYAAGLLDYFFRGTMSVTVIGYNTSTQTYTNLIKNTSGQDFNGGTVSIYGDDPVSGERSLVSSTNLNDAVSSGDLPNGQSFTMTFSGSMFSTNKLLAIYQGSIGMTDPVDADIAIVAQSFYPWFTQIKGYNFKISDDSHLQLPYTLTTTLTSDDFPFTPTQGNYQVILSDGTFDDEGTIGGVPTTIFGSPCGAPATFANLPIVIPAGQVSIVGNHLTVVLTCTDNCPVELYWKDVLITWRAWPSE